jgi:alpha-glucosidase
VLAFRRGPVGCFVNLGPAPVPLPAGASVLLSSQPLAGHELPADTAAWVALGPG